MTIIIILLLGDFLKSDCHVFLAHSLSHTHAYSLNERTKYWAEQRLMGENSSASTNIGYLPSPLNNAIVITEMIKCTYKIYE